MGESVESELDSRSAGRGYDSSQSGNLKESGGGDYSHCQHYIMMNTLVRWLQGASVKTKKKKFNLHRRLIMTSDVSGKDHSYKCVFDYLYLSITLSQLREAAEYLHVLFRKR